MGLSTMLYDDFEFKSQYHFFPIMIQTGILKNMYANATEICYEKISSGTNLDLIYIGWGVLWCCPGNLTKSARFQQETS